MKNFYKNQNKNNQRGVAILFAILLVSIVLTVGLTLLNITLRQLVLSSLARESQFAFYAADSARNCARYYDSVTDQDGSPSNRPFGYFELSSGSLAYRDPTTSAVNCGNSAPVSVIPSGASPKTFSFILNFTDGVKATCAQVKVYKIIADGTDNPISSNPSDTLANGKTVIESRGYNNFDSASSDPNRCYRVSDRTVERASTMIY